ncbi:hypothetical protein D5W64_12260 [Salmonella enterica subsp. enterica serovar Saintpaul]|nr:hypothetical protein [Salmonella enterica subsp. enterica serovar Saintpaul]
MSAEDHFLKIEVNKTEGTFTESPISEEEKAGLSIKIKEQMNEIKDMVLNSVSINELLNSCEGKTILIQRINDDRYTDKITNKTIDVMRDIFNHDKSYKVTVVQMDGKQMSPIADYLTNSIVLTVYPGCITVDKARGTTGDFEGKSVIINSFK